MSKIPSSLLSVPMLLTHILALPAFFMGFILIYESEWISRFLDTGLGVVFNALMLTCILIGVLCASRIPMTAFRSSLRLGWWQYAFWTFAEIVVFSAFAALYMALVYGIRSMHAYVIGDTTLPLHRFCVALCIGAT